MASKGMVYDMGYNERLNNEIVAIIDRIISIAKTKNEVIILSTDTWNEIKSIAKTKLDNS